MLFEARDLVLRSGAFAPNAIGPFTFQIRVGTRVLVVGPSGSGKSTLLNFLTGVAGDEVVVSGESRRSGTAARAGVRYIPQDAIFTETDITV